MYKLGEKILDNCGNKARYLSMLKSKGYNIPLGVVIDFEEFKQIIQSQKLNFETIDKIQIPDELIQRIKKIIPSSKSYAIRSSANIEDGRNISLAGKYTTFLNVVLDDECFKDKIKNCFLSLYSTENLQFYRKNHIDINKIEMNVIIQEMIESNVSGILFTINPITGNDKQIVLEYSKGVNDAVNGKTVPERIVYNWIEEKYEEEPKISILGDSAVKKIINISLSLQQDLGFPIDVEFGVYDSKLYIFQIRPITKVENKELYYRYTCAKTDVITTLMWSLYNKVYTDTTLKFLNLIKVSNSDSVYKPIVTLKYSKIYWNLSLLKKVLQNIPGYIERNLDEYLKVGIDYLDDGIKNINQPKKVLGAIHRKNILDTLKKQVINADEYRNLKLKEIENLKEKLENETDLKENLKRIIDIYIEIKQVYIWQVYINIIYKVNINNITGNILNKTEFNNLFLGIDDVAKNAPSLYMWDKSRKIQKDKKIKQFFDENLDAEIFYLYRKDRDNPNIKEFLSDFIDLYGYHSFNGNDIVYKCYDEEVLKVIKMYRDMLELDDKFDPLRDLKIQNKLYEETVEKLQKGLKKSQLKEALKSIQNVREYIKKENALYDLVEICQSVLRKYLLSIGKIYKSEYILDLEEDIFYLDYQEILAGLKVDDTSAIKKKILKNKVYYNSFLNYKSAIDIMPTEREQININHEQSLKGVGASFGKIKARACIVNSKDELKNLKKYDILVTKYMDNEIFKKVNILELSGIVTEFGGILCHLAINARENRIPCVVGIEAVTTKIKSGDIIEINGDTGEIKI